MKALIFTTINQPDNLALMKQRCPDWKPIVAGDLRTPHEATARLCREAGGIYLDPETQMKLGFTHAAAMPWNCYGRKNVAYLFALKEGAEMIFITDDDNVPQPDWSQHVRLGRQKVQVVTSSNGWYNPYDGADTQDAGPITPRGYPWELVGDRPQYSFSEAEANIGVIAGLHLGDPDVDAATRIVRKPNVRSYPEREVSPQRGTLSPYDSQNTVIQRDLVPANMLWSYVANGSAGAGWTRFDDICAGYVGQVIAWKYGYQVRHGRPFVYQERNPHDLASDMSLEADGVRHLKTFIRTLQDTKLTGQTPAEDLQVAAYALLEALPSLPRCLKTCVDTWVHDLGKLGF